MSELKIFLVDDHPLLRDGLRGLLDTQPDMTVVGEASDGEMAIEGAGRLRPDVVVMDISMPGIGGIEATRRIRRDYPEIRVVALTAHEDRGYRQQMLDAGASDFVLKRAAADDLVRAVRRAAAGESNLAPRPDGQAREVPAQPPATGPVGGELSAIEADVLRLVAHGQMKREIAERLGISVRMVDAYKALATEKLGLTSRVEIVQYAAERGWLDEGGR